MHKFVKLLVVVAIACVALVPAKAQADPVGLALTLLVDVSGSVDANEFDLQRTGYVAAFQSLGLQDAIMNASGDGIAARLIYWSSAANQQVAVDWAQITGALSANSFAAAIAAAARPFTGSTAPGNAINFAVSSGYQSPWSDANTRFVFDVSGDGAQNDGASTLNAALAARALGITINGLPILGETGLQAWYQNNIVTPGGGFLAVANSFDDFGTAVEGKIVREVTNNPVPEPASIILFGTGVAGAAGRAWRRRRR